MTIPYNISARSMIRDVKELLVRVDSTKDDCTWYTDSEKNNKALIMPKDKRGRSFHICFMMWCVQNTDGIPYVRGVHICLGLLVCGLQIS
jgi:hypothetical protein